MADDAGPAGGVSVMLRIRPRNAKEQEGDDCWSWSDDAIVETGSGKTHSILGVPSDPGILQRTVADIFAAVDERPDSNWTVRVSYMEVYNEEINDLLAAADGDDKRRGKNLKIVSDDPVKGAVIAGLSETAVEHATALLDVIRSGESQGSTRERNSQRESARAYGSTEMNDKSSRSHTICKLSIDSEETFEGDGDDDLSRRVVKRAACLSLVDLAGSERQKSTGASGARLKEGSNINRSLLTLGRVINKLTEQANRDQREKRREHRRHGGDEVIIPYRESKLTRILKQSLGGNARTTILCTMTTAPVHLDESLSTLRFGQLCKLIKNAAQENVQMTDKMVAARLQQEVSDLKQELSRVKSAVAEHGGEDFANLVEGHETSAFAVVAKREREHSGELEARLHHVTKEKEVLDDVVHGLRQQLLDHDRELSEKARAALEAKERDCEAKISVETNHWFRERALEGREATCVEREHTVKRNLKRVALELDATRVERDDAARVAETAAREVDAAAAANAAAGALLGEAMMKHAMATIEANRAKDARAELLAREEACESFCDALEDREAALAERLADVERREPRLRDVEDRERVLVAAEADLLARRRGLEAELAAIRDTPPAQEHGRRLGEQLEAAKASHRDLKARAALDKADETRDAAAARPRPPPPLSERRAGGSSSAPGQEKGRHPEAPLRDAESFVEQAAQLAAAEKADREWRREAAKRGRPRPGDDDSSDGDAQRTRAAALRPPEVPAYAAERSLSLPRTRPAASDGDAPGEARPPPPKARLWGKLGRRRVA
ncbi:hypothetical protein JL721_12754 [Aureococcus anophagefferens]|nr:hypothetical protein JL721_12754 [Aureococcus anophagefferens]